MAEIATIARPYAEALFKTAGADAGKLGDEAADVLGMLLIYCARAGVDLDQAMQRKWLKWLEPEAQKVEA